MEHIAVCTIGHSTRPIDEFASLLKTHSIQRVVDVRTAPRSLRNPQFNQNALAQSLQSEGIGYTHMPELGGLRHALPDSPNMGWRNETFRGYADYMQTAEFAAGLARLIETARGERIAVLCAEAVPWRCHRSLIADALTVRGVEVLHILSEKSPEPHRITPWARVEGESISYPALM